MKKDFMDHGFKLVNNKKEKWKMNLLDPSKCGSNPSGSWHEFDNNKNCLYCGNLATEKPKEKKKNEE